MTPDGVFFGPSSPLPPYVEFRGNVRTNQAVGDRNGFIGAGAVPDGDLFFIPLDPTPGSPPPFP